MGRDGEATKEAGKNVGFYGSYGDALDELARYHLSGIDLDKGALHRVLGGSDSWWNAIFESANIGMMFGTLDGQVVLATPKLEAILGYTQEEMQEIGVPAMTHPDDMQMDFELFSELLAGKRDHYQLEKRYIRKDGATIWGLLTLLLLHDENDQPRFVVGMLEDITESKRAAEYKSRLERAETSRRRALQLNDSVLQQLVVAKLGFDSGDTVKAHEALDASLRSLKTLIDTLLAESAEAGEIRPGTFVRDIGHGVGDDPAVLR